MNFGEETQGGKIKMEQETQEIEEQVEEEVEETSEEEESQPEEEAPKIGKQSGLGIKMPKVQLKAPPW